MRVVILPQIVTRSAETDSDWIVARLVADSLEAIEPSHSYVVLREKDVVASKPWLTPFAEEQRQGFNQLMGYADVARLVSLFGWQQGPYPTDAVFTGRAAIAPALQLAMGSLGGGEMPVVIMEPRVYGPEDESAHNLVTPTQQAARAAGYASCWGLYWSHWEKRQALAAASLYVAPAVLKRWDERAWVLENPVSVVVVDPGPHTRPVDRKRVLFAGRLNPNKRWEELLEEVFAPVFESRTDVEVWLHGGTGAYDKLVPSDHRWHRTSERLPAEQYTTLLETTQVGAYLSRDEGANATVQELLLAGVVMVLPKRPWVDRLWDGMAYPYVAGTKREMAAMVDWALDRYEEAYAALEPFRAFIRARRSPEGFRARFAEMMAAVKAAPRPGGYRMYRGMTRDACKDRDGIGWSQMLRIAPDYRSGPMAQRAVRSAYACYQAVRDLDDCRTAEPWIRRPEEGRE